MKVFISILFYLLQVASLLQVSAKTTLPVEKCVELIPARANATSFGVVHTCGPKRRLMMWGNNGDGQLGREDFVQPFFNPNSSSSSSSEYEGATNNATTDDGNGTETGSSGFAWVRGFNDSWIVAACVGDRHTCVLYVDEVTSTGGDVKCFGNNEHGQLGQGSTETNWGGNPGDMDALPPVDVGGKVVAMACAANTTCVLMEDNRRVKCFGSNSNGQAGLDNITDVIIGDSAEDMGENLATVDLNVTLKGFAMGSSLCALSTENQVYCWGANHFGELGQGNLDEIGSANGSMQWLAENPVDLGLSSDDSSSDAPTLTPTTEANATLIPTTSAPSIFNDSTLTPSVSNSSEYEGSLVPTMVPSSVNSSEYEATLTPTSGEYETATSPTTAAGEYENNPVRRRRRRVLRALQQEYEGGNQTESVSHWVESVHAGFYYSCALIAASNGTRGVKCWGFGGSGALGYENSNNVGDAEGSMGTNLSFVDYGGRNVTHLVTGFSHTCALFNQTAACYGSASHGQTGTDTSQDSVGNADGSMGSDLKEVMMNNHSIWEIAAGANATVVLAGKYFEVFAFGSNNLGQLGRNSSVASYGGNSGDMAGILPINLGICTSLNFLELGYDIHLIPGENKTTASPSVSGEYENATGEYEPSGPPTLFNITIPPALDNVTFPPAFMGNDTERRRLRSRRLQATPTPTIVPSAETSSTLTPTVVPSVGQVSLAPTTVPSTMTNETGNSTSNETTLETPYYIHNPLNATSVVVLVHGPKFVSSPDFGVHIHVGPGETRYFNVVVVDPNPKRAALGEITGTFWCEGDTEAVFDLPVIAIGYDVPPAPPPGSGSGAPTSSPSAASSPVASRKVWTAIAVLVSLLAIG